MPHKRYSQVPASPSSSNSVHPDFVRIRQSEGTGVVPVVLRLDHFRAGRGDEFAEVQFQPLGLRRLQAEECLLDVVELAGTAVARGIVHEGVRAPVKKVDMSADRIWIVIEGEFGGT